MHHTNCSSLSTYNMNRNNSRGNPCCILCYVNCIIMLDHRSLLPIRLNCVSDSLVFMLFGHTYEKFNVIVL